MSKIVIVLTTLTLILSSCSSPDNQQKGNSSLNAQSAQTPQTDAQIVNMLMTVNTEEMNLAKVGKKNAQNKNVRNFADKMFKEHAKNNERASQLRNKNNIGLTETKPSNKMKVKAESAVENLKTMKGKKFDKAFMDAQVKLHQKTLQKLESTLIPNSKDTELKAMLQETRAKVEHHLQEAQELQNQI